MNEFVKANTLGAGANGAITENGAISYATIGSELLNQFGKAASYRGRPITEVWKDQTVLWAENPEAALKFPFYLRMITRKSNILNGGATENVQRGAGVRDEAFKRLLWIAKYHPDEFYRNLWILPVVGSWKDLWVLMAMAGTDRYLSLNKFYDVIAAGINDENHRDLVKKFLPRIRSKKACNTPWAKMTNELAKGFAEYVGWTPVEYRHFKSTGKAHEFQRIICKGLYSKINWNAIPGKALLNLVSGEFLERHQLVKSYISWIETQPVVKFNGYPFELGRKAKAIVNGRGNMASKITIDKQFDNLIATASENNGAIQGNVLCAIDTSSSMSWGNLDSGGTTAFDVCVSLGIYFSELNKGAFHNVVAAFDNKSKLYTLKGTFTDKLTQLMRMETAWGSTNFQSVIDLIVGTRKKNPKIPLGDYPSTLVVVSDMQFNPAGGHGWASEEVEKTNYETAMEKLRTVFPEEYVKDFKIIWWYCANRATSDFPSTMENPGTYMISGFDGAVISFLLGGEGIAATAENGKKPTMEDIIRTAFSQEVMQLIR